ncbi:MAG TPA: pyridoxamine 5'-phosphate oxidase family protein [Clostridia bacterium]|nr:pyridoxamine 5'-phosphate oxidase family protein [Clostridia bacterium]
MGKLRNNPEKERDAAWALAELAKAPWATLCLADGNEPYGVPISHALIENRLYFHCADAGKKVDMLERNPHACVSAVSFAEAWPEKMTMRYRSVVATGAVELLPEDSAEKAQALYEICRKFAASNPNGKRCAEKPNGHVRLYRMTIEDITGKESHMDGRE